MVNYKKGDKVKISTEVDNESYEEFVGEVLIVTNVATNEEEHPGYDSSVDGQGLYDLKTVSGKEVPFSLYDYELEKV